MLDPLFFIKEKAGQSLSFVLLWFMIFTSMLVGMGMGALEFLSVMLMGGGAWPIILPLFVLIQITLWYLSGKGLNALMLSEFPGLDSLVGWIESAGVPGQLLIRGHMCILPLLGAFPLVGDPLTLAIPILWVVGTFIFWLWVIWRYYKL